MVWVLIQFTIFNFIRAESADAGFFLRQYTFRVCKTWFNIHYFSCYYKGVNAGGFQKTGKNLWRILL